MGLLTGKAKRKANVSLQDFSKLKVDLAKPDCLRQLRKHAVDFLDELVIYVSFIAARKVCYPCRYSRERAISTPSGFS
jgi:hypothetical protein